VFYQTDSSRFDALTLQTQTHTQKTLGHELLSPF
jgi:hypothetical protein